MTRARPAETTLPRIVFVDDEPELLDLMKRLFKTQPYECHVFSDGPSALGFLAENDVHVIVSDLRMPEMDGLELLQRAAELVPAASRVVLSALSDSTSLLEAINRGRVNRYIVKPWEPSDLVSVINQCVEVASLRRERDRLLEDLSKQSEQLAQQVDERTEQVMALSRPAELGKYASQIVHNLKAPIQAIGGAVFLANLLLEDQTPHRQELQEYLDHAADGARELQRIIAGILLHTVDESFFREESVDLNEVIEREIEFFELDRSFRYEVERRISLDPDLPRIAGNAIQLKQVADALIKNALDAMADCENKVLTVSTFPDADRVVLVVEDTGVGIRTEHLDQIFSPFFTTKNLGEGTGIGLASVQRMVHAYGGTIEVASEPEAGSRFTVRLPVGHARS
jgi:signal transduction histidine kinase